MTRVYFGQLRNCGWILDRYKRFILSPENADCLHGFPSLILVGTWYFFLWVNQPGVKLTPCIHLVFRLRMYEAVSPLSHVCSLCGT